MTELDIRTEDLLENPATKLAVGMILDVSWSMTGEPIEQLNQGVKLFFEEVQKHEIASNSVEVAVVAFSGRGTKVCDFGPIREATPPVLHIDQEYGGTSLGAGMELALDLLDQRKSEYRAVGCDYFQPWAVLLTDGMPTDDRHLEIAPRIAELVQGEKLSVFAIAVGEADLEALRVISPKRPPLRLKGLKFRELFEFLAQSAGQVSGSRPEDKVKTDTTGMDTWAEI